MTTRLAVRIVVLGVGLFAGGTQALDQQVPLFGAPVELTVDSSGPVTLESGTLLQFSIESRIQGDAQARLTLKFPSALRLLNGQPTYVGTLAAGSTRTWSVVVQPKERSDFRILAKVEFLPQGSEIPFVVQQAVTLRVRATEELSDVFVEQKHWPKQKLAGRIRASKGHQPAQEANAAFNALQGTDRPFIADSSPVPGLLERQGKYLASKLGAPDGDFATSLLKEQNLGRGWLGVIGSSERYGAGANLIYSKTPVTYVYRNQFVLIGGVAYVFETRNLSPGGDTVAYLFSLDPRTAQMVEVARNDDGPGSGLGSKIEITPTQTGSYAFVVRSYSPESQGSCDIYLNGEWIERAPFGGAAWRIQADAGDVVHAVGLKRTPNRTDPFMFVSNGPGSPVAWDDDTGMELGAKIVLPMLANAELVVGAYAPALEGTCDLVLNTADGSSSSGSRGDLDGDGLSNELERALGTRVDSIDTDGDGLLDEWEILGVRNTDFRGLGAGPSFPDIYVQVDWMDCAPPDCTPIHNHHPRPASIARIVDSFFQTGYTLHVDDGNPEEGGEGHLLPDPWTHLQYLTLGPTFDQIMAANFDSSTRGGLYRYNIFAHQQAPGNCSSGIAVIRGFKFLVTLGCASGRIGTETEQAGTFMHELGHNLGLLHGGFENLNYKPNYRSVMNYLFQFPGTCGTLGYTTGVVFTPCGAREYFYSFSAYADLDENCLDETIGIGEGPLDWDQDGTAEDTCARADINHPAGGRPDGRYDLLRDNDDYANLFIPVAGFARETEPIKFETVICAPIGGEN